MATTMPFRLGILGLVALGWLAARELPAQVPARGTYAFTHVNVVPMDAEHVLRDQTVVVEAGRITAVGAAASVAVPEEATRIDGSGRYLVPGIADMHGHVPFTNAGGAAEDVLFLFVAAGATTVRGMQGHPSQLELRRRVTAGDIVGPRLWLAAPAMSGATVPDAATAVRLVRTARTEGLPWGGHVSEHVGVAGALAAGQSTIDHLDDYLDAMQPPDSPALAAAGAERARLLPLTADEDLIPELARQTREAHVAVVPTQMLWEVLRGARDPATLADRSENRFVSAETRRIWLDRATQAYHGASRESAAREAELRQRLLKAMSDEGVEILMGTDAPQIFSVPGFSLYRELPLMVESGMTPYEVLRTGTVNVAHYLGIGDKAGTIAVGRFADLLLLETNPLEDIEAISRNAGVMADGRWLSPEAIRARLEAIAAKYR